MCGTTRFSAGSEPIVALHCHCADCRKATGAPYSTWAVFPRAAVAWRGREPKRVPFAERLRLVCPDCGAPLGAMPAEDAAIIVIAAGSLDHPETLKPLCHTWTEDQLPWVKIGDDLPRHRQMMPAGSFAVTGHRLIRGQFPPSLAECR